MSAPVVNLPAARKFAAEALAEKGDDYVDPLSAEGLTCRYRSGDEPSCLVGNVLHRAGYTVDQLDVFDGRGSIEEVPYFVDVYDEETEEPVRDPGVAITPAALAYLGEAQTAQDVGHSWGVAVGRAEKLVAEYGLVDADPDVETLEADCE